MVIDEGFSCKTPFLIPRMQVVGSDAVKLQFVKKVKQLVILRCSDEISDRNFISDFAKVLKIVAFSER